VNNRPGDERVKAHLRGFLIGLLLNPGFTLLEVMISLAIIAGLLVTLTYTLNYHLGIAGRQRGVTVCTYLAKAKLYEIELNPAAGKGVFPKPYSDYSYETTVKDSSFPGMSEISVVVRGGKEDMTLSELIRKSQ
jgi:general secretion pathway protein I